MATSYPCLVCTEECGFTGTIQCNNCNDWMHRECLEISEEELKDWSSLSLQFRCKKCCFIDGVFDNEKSLDRINTAMASRRPYRKLVNAAKSEQKLIRTHRVRVSGPSSDSHGQIDSVSKGVLELFHPAFLQQNIPLAVYGDGNCLYRAVSRAMTGTETYHVHLRLLTAIEMIMNKECYDENSDKRLDSLFTDNRVLTSGYSKLLHDSVVINSFSEMAHIYALSAALNMSIRSYYPPQVYSEMSSEPFTRIVIGRGVKSSTPEICIMWTQCLPVTSATLFKPNHFVPILRLNSDVTHINLDISSSTVKSEQHNVSPNVSAVHANESFSDVPFKPDPDRNSLSPTISMPSGLDSPNYSVQCDDDAEKKDDTRRGKLDKDFMEMIAEYGIRPLEQQTNIIMSWKMENEKENISTMDKYVTWRGSRIKTLHGIVERKYIPLPTQPAKKDIIVVHRYYVSLKASKDYKKKVTYLCEGGLIQSKLAVVEYKGKWPGLIPHGNAKTNNEYTRMPAHVMEEISERVKDTPPLTLLDDLKKRYDVLERPETTQVIRDKKKNDNKTRHHQHPEGNRNNVADHFQILDNMVQENDSYVRQVVRDNGKSPYVILYTNEMIEDLKNLCCTGKTYIGVDKTFNLTNYHVTVLSYKQLSVNRVRTEEPPLFLGPILIHDSSDFETFAGFFHHMKLKLHGSDTSKLILGSDEELAMVKAMKFEFPEATLVECKRHIKGNLERQMLGTTIGYPDRNAILNMIFGDGGVVDADDTVCFEEKCDAVEAFCANISPSFVQYFRSKTRDQLKEKVNKPTRAGLVEEGWTNNNSESINHALKKMIDHRMKPLTVLIELLRNRANGQFKEIRSALLQTGEFRLADTHKQFEVTKETWIRKTKEQKDKLYRQMRKHVPTDAAYVTSTDGQTKVIAPKEKGRKPGLKRGTSKTERTTTIKRRKTAK